MPDDDKWLDEQLLADDPKSKRMWRRDSMNGMTTTEAMKGVPKTAQITTRVPIEQWRVFKRHVEKSEISQGAYVREAVGARMIAEGVDPDLIRSFLK